MSILENELASIVHSYLRRIDEDLADRFRNIKLVEIQHNIPTLSYIYKKLRPSNQSQNDWRKYVTQTQVQDQSAKLQGHKSNVELKIPAKQSLQLIKKNDYLKKNKITALVIPDEIGKEKVKPVKAKKDDGKKNMTDTDSSDSESDDMRGTMNIPKQHKSKSSLSSKAGGSMKTNASSTRKKIRSTEIKSKPRVTSMIGAASEISQSSSGDSSDDDRIQSNLNNLREPVAALNTKQGSVFDVVPSTSSDSSSENEDMKNRLIKSQPPFGNFGEIESTLYSNDTSNSTDYEKPKDKHKKPDIKDSQVGKSSTSKVVPPRKSSSSSDSSNDDKPKTNTQLQTKNNQSGLRNMSKSVSSSSEDNSSDNEGPNHTLKTAVVNEKSKPKTVSQVARLSTGVRSIYKVVSPEKSSSSSDSSNNDKPKTNIRTYAKGNHSGPISIYKQTRFKHNSSDGEGPKHVSQKSINKPKIVSLDGRPSLSGVSWASDQNLTKEQSLQQNKTPNEGSDFKLILQKKNQTSNYIGSSDDTSSSDESSEEAKKSQITEYVKSRQSSHPNISQKKDEHLKTLIAKVKSVPQRTSPQKTKFQNSSESSNDDSKTEQTRSQTQTKVKRVSVSNNSKPNISKSCSNISGRTSDEAVCSRECQKRNIMTKSDLTKEVKEVTAFTQKCVSNEIRSPKNTETKTLDVLKNIDEKDKDDEDVFQTPLRHHDSQKLNKKITLSEVGKTSDENRAERSRKLSLSPLVDASRKKQYSDIVLLKSHSSYNESDDSDKESNNQEVKSIKNSTLSHSKSRKSSKFLNKLQKKTHQSNSSKNPSGVEHILNKKSTSGKLSASLADKISFELDSDSIEFELKNKPELSKSESSDDENIQRSISQREYDNSKIMGLSSPRKDQNYKSEKLGKQSDISKIGMQHKLSRSEKVNDHVSGPMSSHDGDEVHIPLGKRTQKSQQTASESPRKCTNLPDKLVMTQREKSVDMFASQSYSERRKISIMKSIDAIANSTDLETEKVTLQTEKKAIVANSNKKQKTDRVPDQKDSTSHQKFSEVATPKKSTVSSDSDTIENSQLPLSQSSKAAFTSQRKSFQCKLKESISDTEIPLGQNSPLPRIHPDCGQPENDTKSNQNSMIESLNTNVDKNAEIEIYLQKRKRPRSFDTSDEITSNKTSPTKKSINRKKDKSKSENISTSIKNKHDEKTPKTSRSFKKQYQCSYCDYTTINRIWLISHNRIHTGAKSIRFDDKEEITENNVEGNESNVNENEEFTQLEVNGFQCILCDFKTFERHSLVKHIMKHTEDKEFHCKIIRKVSKATPVKHPKSSEIEISATMYECDLCDFRSTHPRNLKMHKNRLHTDERLHKCEICDESFKRLNELNKHVQTHKVHKCADCNKEFKKEGHLRRHIKTHTKEGYLACDTCDKSFPTRSTLERHMQTHLKGKIECHKCDKSFTTEKLFERHSNTHKDFKCQLCAKQFSTQNMLEKHAAFHISKTQSPTRCDLCEEIFPIRAWYVRHMKKSHKENLVCNECHKEFKTTGKYKHHMKNHEKGFNCDQCDFRGLSKYQLTKHTYKHTKPFVCDICDKGFAQTSNLKKHKKVHSKVHKCDICYKSFDTQETYECHMHGHNKGIKIHTKTGEAEENKIERVNNVRNLENEPEEENESHIFGNQQSDEEIETDGRRFSTQSMMEKHTAFQISKTQSPTRCDLCEEIFPIRAWYVRHMKKSHKENLVCNECHKEFKTTGKYKNHMKNHEKGFNCDQCDFRGLSKYQLTKHTYKHTKPFVCDICGKGFAQTSNLKIHREVHSKLYKCDICYKSFDTQQKYECHIHVHSDKIHTKTGQAEKKIKLKRENNVINVENECKEENESYIFAYQQDGEEIETDSSRPEEKINVKSHEIHRDRESDNEENTRKKKKKRMDKFP